MWALPTDGELHVGSLVSLMAIYQSPGMNQACYRRLMNIFWVNEWETLGTIISLDNLIFLPSNRTSELYIYKTFKVLGILWQWQSNPFNFIFGECLCTEWIKRAWIFTDFYKKRIEDPRDARIQKIAPGHDRSHWDQTPRGIEKRVTQMRGTLIENLVWSLFARFFIWIMPSTQ